MKNKIGTLCGDWKKFFSALFRPMTVIPVFGGIFFTYFYLNSCNEASKIIYSLISAALVGVGVNYFSFYYKETVQSRILAHKSDHTIRIINGLISTIYYDNNKRIPENKKSEVSRMIDLIDFWNDYIPEASRENFEKYKNVINDIQQSQNNKNENQKDLKKLHEEKQKIESLWNSAGLTSYMPISGSMSITN